MDCARRFLIVDRHAGFRRFVHDLLAPSADCRECADETEAGRILAGFQPDWILVNLGAPADLETAARLRARCGAARLVILGDVDSDTLRDAALQAGAERYLLKENVESLKELS